MLVAADHVRDVLDQAAAGGDRHDLHAAADAEQREPDVVGGMHQGHLGDVPVVAPAGGGGVRLGQ